MSTSFRLSTEGLVAMITNTRNFEKKDVSVTFFLNELSPASKIDFAGEHSKNASGSGRIEIRRAIETAIGLAEPS